MKNCKATKSLECKATIEFGDDYGDNHTTFHCQLEKGHTGNHVERGKMYGRQPYVLMWSET
jgi:hypothetical protein